MADQVDVLRQLRWLIPFSPPARLFVEAEHRTAPSGVSDVRRALGVLNETAGQETTRDDPGPSSGRGRRACEV